MLSADAAVIECVAFAAIACRTLSLLGLKLSRSLSDNSLTAL
jgi:hypothetical protein